MAEIILSERLSTLVDMVTQGLSVVDVGCDHGFVSISLVQRGISPRVLAMDVRKGPLAAAREHVSDYGYEAYIETRLSDGLREYRKGEADCLICAGMGGRLMMKILTDSREKARSLKELILQPQSELPVFRSFLRDEGYCLLDENILYEEGKYYFVMKVCYAGQPHTFETVEEERQEAVKHRRLADKFGELLLQRRDPVLKQFLEGSLVNLQQICENLSKNDNQRAKQRLAELDSEIADVKAALEMLEA